MLQLFKLLTLRAPVTTCRPPFPRTLEPPMWTLIALSWFPRPSVEEPPLLDWTPMA